MPLSWNEIKHRSLRFSREWGDEACEHAESHCSLPVTGARVLLVISLGCAAGCHSQTDGVAAREMAQQDQRVTPMSVAKHVTAAHAAALMGDQTAAAQNLQGMTRDMLHDAHIPDASRPINREAARAAVQPLAGVRSVVWIDHDNLLVMVGGAQYRNTAMVDRACDALAPLGDTMGVVVNVQDVTATTSEGADAVSRNCQLPEGQRAFMQWRRRIEALDPVTRRTFEAQQGPSSH